MDTPICSVGHRKIWLICPGYFYLFHIQLTGDILPSLIHGTRSTGELVWPYLLRLSGNAQEPIEQHFHHANWKDGLSKKEPKLPEHPNFCLRDPNCMCFTAEVQLCCGSTWPCIKLNNSHKTKAKIPACLLAKNLPWKFLPFFVAEATSSGSQLI